MRFKADERSFLFHRRKLPVRAQLEAREVGRVLEVGDGIARIYGLSGVMSGEIGIHTHQGPRLAFNLERIPSASSSWGTTWSIARETRFALPANCLRVPVGRRLIGRWSIRSATRSTQGAILTAANPAARIRCPGVRGGQPVTVPLQDRYQGDDFE